MYNEVIIFIDQLLQILVKFGETGLFIISFLESFIFPIPTEAIFIPLALANSNEVLWYALIVTISSVLGAVFGYMLGMLGGRPLLNKFFSNYRVTQFESLMQRYGALAILIGGFSPVPYKLITITSGVLRVPLTKLIIYSLISRGARYFLEAFIIIYMGKAALEFITGSNFIYLTVAITLIGVSLYTLYFYLKYKKH